MTQHQPYLIDQDDLVKPHVELVGQDGNAFAILARVMKAWRHAGRPDIAKEFQQRATSDDYNTLLAMAMEYVDEDAARSEEEDEWSPSADEE